MELISVIIPMYNAEKTIERCIKSIINSNVEIVMVNDGSTDGTLEICQKYANINKNIKIISQDNKGPIIARNNGIENASGEYIMFLDSDDFYEDDIIDRMTELIKKYNNPDLIRFRYKQTIDGICQTAFFDEKEKYIEKKDFKEFIYPMFLDGYKLNALWANCVKRKILLKIQIDNSEIRLGDDLLISLEMFSKANNAVFVQDVLYNYVYNTDSITTTNDRIKLLRNLNDIIEVYTTIYKYLIKWDMYCENNIIILNKRFKHVTKKIIDKINKIENL